MWLPWFIFLLRQHKNISAVWLDLLYYCNSFLRSSFWDDFCLVDLLSFFFLVVGFWSSLGRPIYSLKNDETTGEISQRRPWWQGLLGRMGRVLLLQSARHYATIGLVLSCVYGSAFLPSFLDFARQFAPSTVCTLATPKRHRKRWRDKKKKKKKSYMYSTSIQKHIFNIELYIPAHFPPINFKSTRRGKSIKGATPQSAHTSFPHKLRREALDSPRQEGVTWARLQKKKTCFITYFITWQCCCPTKPLRDA